jgi:hypothetical protein
MQFAIGVTVLECLFVKHSCGLLGVKSLWSNSIVKNIIKITFRNLNVELEIGEGITLPIFFLL